MKARRKPSPRKTRSRIAEIPAGDPKIRYYWKQIRGYGENYPEFDWASSEVILSLAYAYDTLRVHFMQGLAEYGLSLAAFNTLMILVSGDGNGCNQQALCKLLLVSRANVTGLVDSLMRRGLVTRSVDPGDRRACIVRITPDGKKLLKALLPGHYRRVNSIAAVLNPGEKKTLVTLLTRLSASFSPQRKKA